MEQIENREAFDYGALALVDLLMALRETHFSQAMKSILALTLAVAEVKDAGKTLTIADPLEVLARMETLPVEGQARVLAIRDVVWAIAS